MKLEDVISQSLDMRLDSETNVRRVIIRGDIFTFLAECDAAICSKTNELDSRIEKMKSDEEEAMKIIEEVGNKMARGCLREKLRDAWKLLRDSGK